MEQVEYWDSVSQTKEFTTPFRADLFARYVSREASVLDVCCGYGRTLTELSGLGYTRLYGVDFSAKLIARAQREGVRAQFSIADCTALPYDDCQFDAAILFAALTCLVDDHAQRRTIEEILRVLKPSACLYVNDFLLNDDQRNLARYEQFAEKLGYGAFELPEGATLRHHREEYILELLSDFQTELYQREIFRTMNGHVSNGFVYIGRKKE